MKISILISTCGDERWAHLAQQRAARSCEGQDDHEVLLLHEPDATVAEVRNANAARATGTHLLFLDADDQIAPGFIHAMNEAEQQGDVLHTPAVQYKRGASRTPPRFWPECDLRYGNWLIIGTLVPRELFHRTGGFREYEMYEDWALWATCVELGAKIVQVPEAVYIAWANQKSRNRNKPRATMLYYHQRIGHDVWPEFYEPPTESEDASRRLESRTTRMLA